MTNLGRGVKDIIQQQSKEYNSRPEVKKAKTKYNREYERSRKANDELYKFKKNIQANISRSIRSIGYRKNSRTQDILACDYNFVRSYLEKQFKDVYIKCIKIANKKYINNRKTLQF